MTRDEAREKIRKLLALATSGNPNEAASAAAKAVSLMERYEILAAEVEGTGGEEPMERMTFGDLMKRLERWRFFLADGVASAHWCAVCYRRLTGEIEIVGRRSDVLAAQRVLEWCHGEIIQLARACAGRGRRYAHAFRLGCVWAIRKAIEAERARLHAELAGSVTSRALMIVDDRAARAQEAIGKIRTVRSKQNPDRVAFAHGAYEARDVYGRTKPQVTDGSGEGAR
jgi:hypothetical protein